jgi:two-component system nitrogen regulation sensor histidine kinase NtrY
VRLRWTLALAFVVLAALQVAVVMPLALRDLSALLTRQHAARVAQLMLAVGAEQQRFRADVARAMDELAQSQALEDVARDAATSPPPPSVTTAAAQLMTPRGLDVLAVLDDEGRTLSSGHLPARLGEPGDPLFAITRLPARAVAPASVELSGAAGLVTAPAVVTARAVDYGDRRVWVVGGARLTEAHALGLARLTGAQVDIVAGDEVIASAGQRPDRFTLETVPLGAVGRVELRFSSGDLLATRAEVQRGFLLLAAVGLLLSVSLGFLISRRVTRPVEALTDAAQRIAAGEPGVTVDARHASGELSTLIATFNRMTGDLKAATDSLLAAERVAAWQEVARRLAHEIKNPLTPIRMSLETLLAASARGQLDERFRGLFSDSARAVLEEVDRLTRIVDSFSHFARLPKPQPSPLDLAQAVQPVMALYAPHDGVTYDVQLAPGVRALADKDQLTQVLVNLVKNAEEAMAPGGGRITVRVRASDTHAVLEVADEGPGVAPELKARLFEPYVTTKPQGTGLGLAIAQRIAQEHGGRLEVLDEAPRGACFRLSLPRLSGR